MQVSLHESSLQSRIAGALLSLPSDLLQLAAAVLLIQIILEVTRALERVPEDKFGWTPHEKSMTMGRLATHLAELTRFIPTTLETESLDLAPPGGAPYQPKTAASRAELLETFDQSVAAARTAIASASDAQWMVPWTLLSGGKTMFSMPRVAVLRGMVMNHIIHHRGQLAVYLRLQDVPVPALYGPSADEQQ